MATEDKSAYLLDATANEVERLTIQQRLTKSGMKDRLIVAPIDLSKPSLHILDSATADGLWLRDVSQDLVEPYTLVGADLMPSFFPPEVPKNTTFIQQDLTKPWPENLHGKFDLVHQRTALAAARNSSMNEAVKQLLMLLKPGGWIQLVEMDITLYDRLGPASKEFLRAIATLMELGGSGWAMCKPGTMVQWLKEAGLENVKEKIIPVPAGKNCQDEELKELSAQHGRISFNLVRDAVQALGGSIAADLPQKYERELREQGGTWDMICATGMLPL